jgi:hypothetical protein
MPQKVRYFFGQISGKPEDQKGYDFFEKGLNNEVIIERLGYKWRFLKDDETLDDEGIGKFFTGHLVKYKTTEEEVVGDSGISQTVVKAHVKAKSRFFIHINSGFLAYNPITNFIGRDYFCLIFEKLFTKALHQLDGKVKIELQEKSCDLWKELKELDSIKKITLKLQKPNPENDDMWKEIEDKLDEMEATIYSETIENRSDKSLNYKKIDYFRSKVAMAQSKYGTGEIIGYKDGKLITLRSKKTPIFVPVPNNIVDPKEILALLLDIFSRILKRSVED